MRTAKGMFRKLGYIEKTSVSNYGYIVSYTDDYYRISIDFEHKEIIKINEYNFHKEPITFEELECIKKLIEEVTNNEEC